MNESVEVTKDGENQRAIPSEWRKTLSDIVGAFKDGDFEISCGVAGVRKISEKDADDIARNIKDYGAHLVDLPDRAWDTSACQWMRSYWDVLVDLFTAEDGASDLVLAVRVYEVKRSYDFEVMSVYVP